MRRLGHEPDCSGEHMVSTSAAMQTDGALAADAGERVGRLQSLFLENLEEAVRLKDLGIRQGSVNIPDEIIQDLDEVVFRRETGPGGQQSLLKATAADAVTVDRALRDLSDLTSGSIAHTALQDPEASTESAAIAAQRTRRTARGFWTVIVVMGFFGVMGAVLGFSFSGALASKDVTVPPIPEVLLAYSSMAASLGLLGSLVFILVGLTRGRSAAAMTDIEKQNSYIRLALGVMVGWVFYFAFSQGAFTSGQGNPPLLLLPFLAGFSTRFVVGLLNKLVTTVEQTLGIGDATTRAAERRRA